MGRGTGFFGHISSSSVSGKKIMGTAACQTVCLEHKKNKKKIDWTDFFVLNDI